MEFVKVYYSLKCEMIWSHTWRNLSYHCHSVKAGHLWEDVGIFSSHENTRGKMKLFPNEEPFKFASLARDIHHPWLNVCSTWKQEEIICECFVRFAALRFRNLSNVLFYYNRNKQLWKYLLMRIVIFNPPLNLVKLNSLGVAIPYNFPLPSHHMNTEQIVPWYTSKSQHPKH